MIVLSLNSLNNIKLDKDATAVNALKVNNLTVETAVPIDAKFTDTIYTHPDTHPATMITTDTNNRFVTDAEKASWNAKVNITDVYNKTEIETKLQNIVNSGEYSFKNKTESFTYDNDGNIIKIIITGDIEEVKDYIYEDGKLVNEILTSGDIIVTKTFMYDNNGNITKVITTVE